MLNLRMQHILQTKRIGVAGGLVTHLVASFSYRRKYNEYKRHCRTCKGWLQTERGKRTNGKRSRRLGGRAFGFRD